MNEKKNVTIVVPVFNEEENLSILFEEIDRAMSRFDGEWDVLFVNDCSTDTSMEVIRGLAAKSEHVHYLSFAENRGQSAAFVAGFEAARGYAVVTIDADLQNDPADIPAMLTQFFVQDADMVIGWRQKRQDTWVKRYSSKFANAVRNWWTRETVRDTGCSLKVMRTDLVRKFPYFKNMHRYLPTLMRMVGGTRIEEVPVNHRHRIHGESKYGTWDRAKAGIYDLIGVRWLQDRNINYTIDEEK